MIAGGDGEERFKARSRPGTRSEGIAFEGVLLFLQKSATMSTLLNISKPAEIDGNRVIMGYRF